MDRDLQKWTWKISALPMRSLYEGFPNWMYYSKWTLTSLENSSTISGSRMKIFFEEIQPSNKKVALRIAKRKKMLIFSAAAYGKSYSATDITNLLLYSIKKLMVMVKQLQSFLRLVIILWWSIQLSKYDTIE